MSGRPRGALAASLQGAPEEFSPGTPVDCYRLAGYIYNRLADMYPQAGWELFNRDDFPGQGDNFIGVRNAIVAWGADFSVHIHQDAGGEAGALGWHIIYYHGEALSLANELLYAMRGLPSPMRYGGIVCRSNVAVLKAPKVSVLIEAGFYTSAQDESIGIDGWGDAIIHGVSNYLQHHWGLSPVGEEEEMPRFEKVAEGVYACARIGADNVLYIHLENQFDKKLKFIGLPYAGESIVSEKGAGGWDDLANNRKGTWWHGANYRVGEILPGFTEGRLVIHAPAPVVIEVG